MIDLLWRPVQLRGWRAALLVALGVAVSWALIGVLRHGSWAPMEDAEILSWLGSGAHLPLSGFLPALADTEAGHPGFEARYRPVFYVFKIGETLLWGAHPAVWMTVRVLMLGVVVASIWWVMIAVVGPFFGTLLAWLAVTQYYWADVWTHNALPEQYAAVAVALMAVAGVRLFATLHRGERAGAALAMMSAATIVAVGCKENFTALCLPLAVAAAFCLHRRAAGRWAYASVILAIAWSCFVLGAALLGVRRGGNTDIFGHVVTPASRLKLLLASWPLRVIAGLAASLVAAAIVRAIVARARPAALAAIDRMIAQQSIVGASIGIIFLSQVIFYNGQFPSFGGRYDFPGRTLELAFWASAFVAVRQLAEALGWRAFTRHLAAAGFAVAIAMYAGSSGFHLHDAAVTYVERTDAMREAVRASLAQAPGVPAPVVMTSGNPSDYETAMFVASLVTVWGAPNPVFLRTRGYSDRATSDAFGAGTATVLTQVARDGEPRYHLRPLRELAAALEHASGRCVGLRLEGYGTAVPVPCDAALALPGRPDSAAAGVRTP